MLSTATGMTQKQPAPAPAASPEPAPTTEPQPTVTRVSREATPVRADALDTSAIPPTTAPVASELSTVPPVSDKAIGHSAPLHSAEAMATPAPS